MFLQPTLTLTLRQTIWTITCSEVARLLILYDDSLAPDQNEPGDMTKIMTFIEITVLHIRKWK